MNRQERTLLHEDFGPIWSSSPDDGQMACIYCKRGLTEAFGAWKVVWTETLTVGFHEKCRAESRRTRVFSIG
jgi:hypothetical protein